MGFNDRVILCFWLLFERKEVLVVGFFFPVNNDGDFSLGVGSLLRQGAKEQDCEILTVQTLCGQKNKRVGEAQAPGEVPLGVLPLVTVRSGTIESVENVCGPSRGRSKGWH